MSENSWALEYIGGAILLSLCRSLKMSSGQNCKQIQPATKLSYLFPQPYSDVTISQNASSGIGKKKLKQNEKRER